MDSITVTEARASLPELLEAVARGDEVTLTRHGRPVAVMIRPDRVRVRRAAATFDEARRLHDLMEAAGSIPLDELPPIDADRAEALIDAVEASRASR